MPAAVPMRNILYMYCYAWDLFHEGRTLAAELDADAPFQDLLAHVLAGAMTRLVRSGLARDYRARSAVVEPLRGCPDFAASIALLARRRRAIVSRFEELSLDTTRNRILKAAMHMLAAADGLDGGLRRRLGGLIRRMEPVGTLRLHAGSFAGHGHHRAAAGYRLPLALARLVLECRVPIAGTGGHRFVAPLGDEVAMGALFEAFVRNFLRREQDAFQVGRQTLQWRAEGAPDQLALLPLMRTDISLTDISLNAPGRRIIIEAKFYREALQHSHEVGKARSAHLYQLFSYLRNVPAMPGAPPVEGILLYPASGPPPAMDVVVHGHRLRLASIDLGAPWAAIRGQLLALSLPQAGRDAGAVPS